MYHKYNMGDFQCQSHLFFILLFPFLTLSHASLQQQQLCHDQEKSALLQFRRRFIINSDIARHLSFCNLPQWVDEKLAVETDRKFEFAYIFCQAIPMLSLKNGHPIFKLRATVQVSSVHLPVMMSMLRIFL